MRLTKEMYCDQDEYRRRAGVYRDTGRVRTQTLCILYSSRSPFFLQKLRCKRLGCGYIGDTIIILLLCSFTKFVVIT